MFFDNFLERRVVVTIANRSTNDHTVIIFPLWFFNAVHIGDIRLDPQFFQFPEIQLQRRRKTCGMVLFPERFCFPVEHI